MPPPPEDVDVRTFTFEDDGRIPNHPSLPLVLYRGVLPEDAAAVEDLFARHGWVGAWRDGIFPYPHYHSTAHEVLGVVRGRARVQFGGEQGVALDLEPGDVAVLPAGTGHRRLEAGGTFLVVGAYPRGQEDWDLLREGSEELAAARARIQGVPLPEQDPVYGADGPLLAHWSPG